jgi:uncharacterized membrane protein
MLTGHPQSWLIVALILIVGGSVRHFINRHDAHDPLGSFVWALPVAAVALGVAIYLTAPKADSAMAGMSVSDGEVIAIVGKHCIMCHSTHPSHEGFDAPPKGVVFGGVDDLRRHADQILAQAVRGDAMPLGNETHITPEERQKLGAWLLNR